MLRFAIVLLVTSFAQEPGNKTLAESEVTRDRATIVRYIRTDLLQKPTTVQQLAGPWEATAPDSRKGRLYRLRYSIRGVDIGAQKTRDIQASRYFFLYEDAVTASEVDHGDLKKVKCCKADSEKPLEIISAEPEKEKGKAFLEASELADMVSADLLIARAKAATAANPAARDLVIQDFTKKYRDKEFTVQGTVASFTGQNAYTLRFVTSRPGKPFAVALACSFGMQEAVDLARVKIGQIIVIRGVCPSIPIDATEIRLTNCRIVPAP